MSPPPNWEAPAAAVSITVGGSPFTFLNPYPGNVVVSGGTVTTIEVSRDGIEFFNTGIITGQVFLCPGDMVRVTFVVAPTMTWMPILP